MRNNEAKYGAAISVNTGATLTMVNCIISNNTVTSPGATACALYLQGTLIPMNSIYANTIPEGTLDVYDFGLTILNNVNNLVERYQLAPGGTPPAIPFASTADPQLAPASSDPYFWYVLTPSSPLQRVGPRFAPGGAAITFKDIPTLSQWGIMLFGLLLLALGLVVVYNVQTSRKLVLSGYGNTESHKFMNLGRFNIPFDVEKYKLDLVWSAGLAVIGFVAIYLIWGKIISDDIIGMSITVPIVAYVLYLMKKEYE